MASLPIHAPSFGDTVPLEPSAETLAFLARRRSASALALAPPGPTPGELETLLTIAARAPDHGKLAPWRFVILRGAAKAAFVAALEAIAGRRPDSAKAVTKLGKIRRPPVTVAVVSRPATGEIPEWEQQLSAGAVCFLLAAGAQAMGYGANWITDWYAYDPDAAALLGLTGDERVAGFIQLGTATEVPLERVRPDLRALVSDWEP